MAKTDEKRLTRAELHERIPGLRPLSVTGNSPGIPLDGFQAARALGEDEIKLVHEFLRQEWAIY